MEYKFILLIKGFQMLVWDFKQYNLFAVYLATFSRYFKIFMFFTRAASSENMVLDIHPAKIQISLHILTVWSESPLDKFLIAMDAKFLHADNENWSDCIDAQADLSLHRMYMQGWETSGLILISGLRTFILCMNFHFYTCWQYHPFVSKVVIWVNICLK